MKKILFTLTLTLLVVTNLDLHADINANALHPYLWANYKQFGHKHKEAFDWYQKSAQANPPVHFYEGFLHFLGETGNVYQIVALMPQLEKQFTDDLEIQQIFARALQRTGKAKEAHERFINLSKKFPDNQQLAFNTANIYLQRKELDNAVAVIDRYLDKATGKPNNFIFHFLKAQIHLMGNKSDSALNSVSDALSNHKQFDKGWLMYAMLQEQKGQFDQAIEGFTNFLELSPRPNKQIEQHLLQLAFKQKISDQNKRVFVMEKSCFAKALALFDQQEYKKALKQIDNCLQQSPTDPEMRLLKIQILSALNRINNAITLLEQWIMADPDQQEWYSTLHLLARNHNAHNKTVSTLEKIQNAYPEKLLPALYLADAYMRIGDTNAALESHKKALTLTLDNTIKVKILFYMGRLYFKQKDYPKMISVLTQGINLSVPYPPLYNLLAYYYAKETDKLTQAQALVDRALKYEHNNPHYLDTQALIFYRQKKYNRALKILQTIAQVAPNDFTILSHLGKTYYQLGNAHNARETIKRAQKVAHHDNEKEIAQQLLKQWQNTTTQ